jgi:anti-sigma regulatory factor (Ser/Thr protein kinase)
MRIRGAAPVALPVADLATAETVVASLRLRFPGVMLWYGTYTGHWWMFQDGRLVEAATSGELVSAITTLLDPRHLSGRALPRAGWSAMNEPGARPRASKSASWKSSGPDRSAVRVLGARVFPAAFDQVRTARRWAVETLGSGHPASDDTVLLLSETFTNAVHHGRGHCVQVRLFGDGHLVGAEVVDEGGDTLPHLRAPDDESGRGMAVVHALALDWGYEVLDQGHLLVWFIVATSPVRAL